MQVNITNFNYKPGIDFATGERRYLQDHVEMAKRLPDLRTYLLGTYRGRAGAKAAHLRAAVWTFDSGAGAGRAMNSAAGLKMREHGATLFADIQPLGFDGTVIAAMDSMQIGKRCFMAIAMFDLKVKNDGLEVADRRYLAHHTVIARRLPGLRYYVTGRMFERNGYKPDRFRCAIVIFDNFQAFDQAFRSEVGVELAKDEAATLS
ncbi:MAG: EthD family reductase, partial [Candidatus Binataceae bacterium]